MSAWTHTSIVKKALQNVTASVSISLSPAFHKALRIELAANRGNDALLCRTTFAFNNRLIRSDASVPDGLLVVEGRKIDLLSHMTKAERHSFIEAARARL